MVCLISTTMQFDYDAFALIKQADLSERRSLTMLMYAVCRMQYALCSMQYAVCSMQSWWALRMTVTDSPPTPMFINDSLSTAQFVVSRASLQLMLS